MTRCGKVRVLGEDLVLFRDRQGGLGLIGERCAHRAVELRWGIPDDNGLRCPYHGWLYGADGQCLDTPLEDPKSTFKERVSVGGYPVQELGGLVFAYLGPKAVLHFFRLGPVRGSQHDPPDRGIGP